MLSQVLKRYYEPLRLPIQPGMLSSPYTGRLMLLYASLHRVSSTGQNIIHSMPPLLPRKIRREDSVINSRLPRPSPSVHQVGIFA